MVRLLLIPPPIHPEDPGPLPESVLLDPFGYLSDRTNCTTAMGVSRAGKLIRVTIWPATPPRVSCLTIHCPDLNPSAFGDLPRILTAEDDLLLLRVAICRRGDDLYSKNNDYFVYQAGAGNKPPSLKLLPMSPAFSDHEVALLRRRRDRDMYFVVALCPDIKTEHYNLHLYSSETEKWSTKLMYVDSQPPFRYTYPSKVIAIGGELGSVGWVDLWRGILICDVLLNNNNNKLRCIALPPPPVPRPLKGYPNFVRDIIVLKGHIKYFELTEGWVATTKTLNPSNVGSGNNWEVD